MPSKISVDQIAHSNETNALEIDTSGNVTIQQDLKFAGNAAIKDSAGNNVISESSGVITVNADAAVISGSSTGDLVRITQTGSGNALVVEDSANPDSTPFVVDANGRLVIGNTTNINSVDLWEQHSLGSGSSYAIGHYNWQNGGGTPQFFFNKSKSGTVGTQGAVTNGTNLGLLKFTGDDGTNFIEAVRITAQVDGTPGTNDMPGRLIFSTTADGASSATERMRIDSSGNVGINTAPDSNSKLHILDDTSSLDDYTIQIESYTPAIVLHDISGASTDFAIQVDGSALMFRYGDASTGTQLASEAMRIESSGLVYQEGNTNQSVKTKSIMARWGSMIMSKIVSTGSCNGSGASITWESININGDNRQIFASSSTGTPSGYLAITDAEGRFPIILVDCGGFMQLEISSTIPSFWGRVYVRDDISFAASFS